MRIGMIGLDTSHVTAFAGLLHEESHPYHVPGGRVVVAFPGGSSDFPLSMNRVGGFTEELHQKHHVEIVDEISQLKGKCDAVLLESMDGRVHLEQFQQIVNWGLPIFVDKPLTVSSRDAMALVALAQKHQTPLFSSSSLRFAEDMLKARVKFSPGTNLMGTFFGPLAFEDKSPGFYWYGIHTVEMMYAVLGRGCESVLAGEQENKSWIQAYWRDGREVKVEMAHDVQTPFSGEIVGAGECGKFEVLSTSRPFYASLLGEVIQFFKTGVSPVAIEESLEIIRFIEAANQSLKSGVRVRL